MYRNTFRHALANTLVASVVNYTVWFAVTFWVYLETHSVFATGVIAGIFLASPRCPACGSAASSTITPSAR